MPSPLRSQAAAYVLLPLASACWAGNHVIARAAGGHVPPASLAVVRWALVALIVLPFAVAYARQDWPKLKRNGRVMLLLTITGGGLFGTLQFVALHFTTALNMGVVGSISPAFIVAASWILFRDRLSPLQLVGVMISLSGVLVIVSRLDLARLASFSFNGGDLVIIANMVLWAIYCACLRLRPDIHPMTFMLAMAVIAGIGNVPFAALEYAFDYRLQSTLADAADRTLRGPRHHPARLLRLEPRRGHRRRAEGRRLPAYGAGVQRRPRHHHPGRDRRGLSSAGLRPDSGRCQPGGAPGSKAAVDGAAAGCALSLGVRSGAAGAAGLLPPSVRPAAANLACSDWRSNGLMT